MNEALDFLSERRAYFFGLKELEDSFRILKVGTKTLLPAFIPQMVLPNNPHVRIAGPVRAAGQTWEQILPTLPHGILDPKLTAVLAL